MGSILGSDDASRFEQLEAEVDKCIGRFSMTTGEVVAEKCRPSIPETRSFTAWLKKVYHHIYNEPAPPHFAKDAFFHSIIDFQVAETSPEIIRFVVMLHHAKEIWDKIPTPKTGHKQPTEELINAYNTLYDTYIKRESHMKVSFSGDLFTIFTNERFRAKPWSQKAKDPYYGAWLVAEQQVWNSIKRPLKSDRYIDSKWAAEFVNKQKKIAAHRQYDNKLLLNDLYGNNNQGSQGYRSQIMGPYNNYHNFNNDKISADGIGGIRYNNNGYDWMLIAMNMISLMMVICLLCSIFTIIVGVFGYIAGRCVKKRKEKVQYLRQFNDESNSL